MWHLCLSLVRVSCFVTMMSFVSLPVERRVDVFLTSSLWTSSWHCFIFFSCSRCQVFQNFNLKFQDLFFQKKCRVSIWPVLLQIQMSTKKKQLDGNPSYTDILRIDIEINTVVITPLSYRRFTPPPKTARFFPHKRPSSASLVTKFKQSGLCICADYGSPYYSPRLPAGAKSGWRRDRNASTEPRRCSSRAGNRETVQAWEQLDLLPVAPSGGTVSRTCEAVCFKKTKIKGWNCCAW